VHVTSFETVYGIFTAALAAALVSDARQARRCRRQEAARLAAQQPDDVGSMVDVVAEPAGYPVSTGQRPCGCVVTRTADGVQIQPCPPHDPQFVNEWEQRLSQ
jgi:hypothetical protein